MEPTTMPNLNPSMPVQSLAQGSGRGQALTGSAGAGALDPFLEIIQRMAAQMQEGSFGQTLPNIQGAEANAPGGLEGDEDLLTAYAAMLVSGVQVLPEPEVSQLWRRFCREGNLSKPPPLCPGSSPRSWQL